MFDHHGRTALVTGASSGIGTELARQLAARGSHVVLVARSAGRLEALASELRKQHGVRAEALPADLTERGAPQHIRAELAARGLSVDVLVNNAGFATYGPFEEVDGARQASEIALNIGALVELTHALLPEIIAAHGGILNVASTAAFQPVPFMAVYGASKAFVLSFSEALWGELSPRGVRVLALCPGATQTAFFDVVGAEEASVGKRASAADVARAGLDAFDAGRSYLVPGWGNYLTSVAPRIFGRATTVRVTARLMRPRARALPRAV